MQYFILSIAEDSSISGHLGFFHICPVVNRAARNTGVHVSFQDIHSSRYLPRSGIVGSYSSSIFSFFKETPYCLETGNWTRFQKCNFRVGHLLFDEGLLWTLSEHSILPRDKILSLFHHIPVVEQLSEDAE